MPLPHFDPPATIGDLQIYLNDTSTASALIDLYQNALYAATDRVYTYLGRDYTTEASKLDIFWGDDTSRRRLTNPAGEIVDWKYYDTLGNETVADESTLHLFENGNVVIASGAKFSRGFEHRIAYKQPVMFCPDIVKQIVIEIAARIYEESKQGAGALGIESEWDAGASGVRYQLLTDRERELLAPYRKLNL